MSGDAQANDGCDGPKPMTGCDELKPHYKAYVMRMLEGARRAVIETHLARGCAACTQGVAAARVSEAELSGGPGDAAPPAPSSPKEPGSAAGPRWGSPWVWVGAAAVVLFSAYTTVETRRLAAQFRQQEQRLVAERERAAQLTRERQEYLRALAVTSAPGTRVLALPPTRNDASYPVVHVFWHDEAGLVLAARHVPAPSANRTYQLWLLPRKGSPLSAGIFRPSDHADLLWVAAPPAPRAAIRALVITEEPAGGRPQPTSPPLWAGAVP